MEVERHSGDGGGRGGADEVDDVRDGGVRMLGRDFLCLHCKKKKEEVGTECRKNTALMEDGKRDGQDDRDDAAEGVFDDEGGMTGNTSLVNDDWDKMIGTPVEIVVAVGAGEEEVEDGNPMGDDPPHSLLLLLMLSIHPYFGYD